MKGLIILFIAMAVVGLMLEAFAAIIYLMTDSERWYKATFAGAIVALSGCALLMVALFVGLIIGVLK